MSRRSMPYHRLYHQDAIQGNRKLSLEQRGAYTTILYLIYDEGGPIDRDERWIAGELNCSLRKARVLLDELIELRKLYVTSTGKISNHRAETELENALKISRKCSESVMKREEKKRERAEIVNKINKNSERSINNRSTIPNTSTIYNKYNSEYDVERARPHAEDQHSLDEDEIAQEETQDAVPVPPNAPPADPMDAQSLASPRLIASLTASPERRAAMHSLVSIQRQRRH